MVEELNKIIIYEISHRLSEEVETEYEELPCLQTLFVRSRVINATHQSPLR